MKKVKNLVFAVLLLVVSSIQAQTEEYVREHYDKKEVKIKMRDGVLLHTTIYSPKDKSQEYPILMMRTPYSCAVSAATASAQPQERVTPEPPMMTIDRPCGTVRSTPASTLWGPKLFCRFSSWIIPRRRPPSG